MSFRGPAVQFWDTSALIGIILRESHTPKAIRARDEGKRWLAWAWIQIEAHAALVRNGGKPADFKSMQILLDQFEFLSFESEEFPLLKKVLDRHRLRSADAGHLFCLIKARKLIPDLTFVCFDNELTKAAEAEGIRVFS